MRKQKLNILVFLESFSTPTETFVYNQVIGQCKDHNVSVVCLSRINVEKFPFEHVKIIPIKENKIVRKVKKSLQKKNFYLHFKNTNFRKELTQFIDSFQPDIIHCHFGIQALILLDNLENKNIPVFVTFHGYDASKLIFESQVYQKRLRDIFNEKLIYPLFVAQSLLDNLNKNNIYSANSNVLHLGVDPHYFQRSSYTKSQDTIFLQISSFTEKKGHEFTVKAFHIFVQKNPHFRGKLILAGEGPLFNPIKKLVQSLALQPFVKLPGLVNREEVKNLMEEAHIFLHHSITASDGNTEGIPTVIMEAMAMELPILSTLHSGIPELVIDDLHGYLIPEKDINTYVQKLDQIQSWTYIKKNRETILSHFTSKIHLKKLAQTYNTALS